MLTIRLQRIGKRNSPSFRIVVAEKESHVSKKITESLGNYDPKTKDFKVKEDRVKYWLDQHINLSPTIHNLFVTKGLLDAKKVKAFSTPKKPAESAVAPAVSEAVAAPEAALKAEAPADAEETAEVTPDVEAKTELVTEPAVEKPENQPQSAEQAAANPEQI